MPADPVEAGRKGGRSRSEKKLAAAKRNGFQPRPKPAAPAPLPVAAAPGAEPVPQCATRPSHFLVVPR